jgi:hypothetical protein
MDEFALFRAQMGEFQEATGEKLTRTEEDLAQVVQTHVPGLEKKQRNSESYFKKQIRELTDQSKKSVQDAEKKLAKKNADTENMLHQLNASLSAQLEA